MNCLSASFILKVNQILYIMCYCLLDHGALHMHNCHYWGRYGFIIRSLRLLTVLLNLTSWQLERVVFLHICPASNVSLLMSATHQCRY